MWKKKLRIKRLFENIINGPNLIIAIIAIMISFFIVLMLSQDEGEKIKSYKELPVKKTTPLKIKDLKSLYDRGENLSIDLHDLK